jgi:crossover junction endodeoxyribonuclease RusA
MSEQSLWLPFPPSVNNLFSQGIVKRKIRRFPSKQYKAWRKQAELLISTSKLKAYTVPVVIRLALTPKDSRPRDADNYNKPIIDALVNMRVLQGDDSQHVKAVTAFWNNPDTKAHGVMVHIRPARMAGKAEALSAAERAMLERWRREPLRLVSPRHKAGKTLSSLIAKGYIEALPGLFHDAPQAYRVRAQAA